MSDSYLERVANELADLALADQAASGDITIVDAVGEVLGASSQTLQESFLTAVRVRRAEARARELLKMRMENGYKDAPKPPAAPMQHEKGEEDGPADEIEEDDILEDEDNEFLLEEDDEDEEPEKPTVLMPRRVKRG